MKVLWDTLMPFADYALQQGAHSAGYGVLAVLDRVPQGQPILPSTWPRCFSRASAMPRTAWVFTSRKRRRMGLRVPSRPTSTPRAGDFAATDGDVRSGAGAVRNVGSAFVEQVVAERTKAGPFTPFHDFLRRVPIQVANKRTVESPIKAGAFDLARRNAQGRCLKIHEDAVDAAVSFQARRSPRPGGGRLRFASGTSRSWTRAFRTGQSGAKRDKLAFERARCSGLHCPPSRSAWTSR